jgi:magnesium-transporting ATPase (P-type)
VQECNTQIGVAEQKESPALVKEPSEEPSSRYRMLSVAVALTVAGLIVFYLPYIVQRPFDWKTEGHLIGLALAVIGAVTILVSVNDITNRSSFLWWAGAILAAAVAVGLLAIIGNVSLSQWLSVILLIVSAVLIAVAVYALVFGFAKIKDTAYWRSLAKVGHGSNETSGEDDREETPERKKLSAYDWATLTVATVAAVATVVAAVASFLP